MKLKVKDDNMEDRFIPYTIQQNKPTTNTSSNQLDITDNFHKEAKKTGGVNEQCGQKHTTVIAGWGWGVGSGGQHLSTLDEKCLVSHGDKQAKFKQRNGRKKKMN